MVFFAKFEDHKSLRTISQPEHRATAEGSGLDLWIEDMEKNKLVPSGISKLAGVREFGRYNR
jgi:hypothetical protein